MRRKLAIAACLAALPCAAGPLDALKGKVKEGMHEYKMEMDVPGAPAGAKKHVMTFQKCLTAQDIEKGQIARGGGGREKMQENCEVKDFSMSGNTATYKVVCKPPKEVTADYKMTFTGDGYKADMTTTMKHEGKPMIVKQHMESRYLGPCK